MSAAWRTGYVKRPALRSDSSTSESSRAFREAASLDFDSFSHSGMIVHVGSVPSTLSFASVSP